MRSNGSQSVLMVAWTACWFSDAWHGIYEFHKARGDAVRFVDPNKVFPADFAGVDLVYLWNGNCDRTSRVARVAWGKGCKIVFAECGWFPQDKFVYFDQRGTNGKSDLHFDPLDWLEEEDFARVARMRESYREGREISEKGYVFCPLQLPSDSQIVKWSPFRWMGEFVREARRRFPEREIVFRKHPKDSKDYEDLDLGERGKGDLKDLICGSDLVYGINSTVLLEAALMGKKVVSIGKSFLDIGPSRDHALAALLARQIPIGETNLEPWTRRGRGLEHLC